MSFHWLRWVDPELKFTLKMVYIKFINRIIFVLKLLRVALKIFNIINMEENNLLPIINSSVCNVKSQSQRKMGNEALNIVILERCIVA